MWKFAFPGLGIVAAGAIFAAFACPHNSLSSSVWSQIPGAPWAKYPGARRLAAILFLAVGIGSTLGILLVSHNKYYTLATAEKTGNVRVVEGVVTNFTPMPVDGHAMESFCVEKTCFQYSDHVFTGGFNNTSSQGGPIRAGLPVRVTYYGRRIVKLEIGK
ncbi:MAG: hypothetical protein WB646_21230 [Steroidobacteraceae bacterium]